MDIGERIKDTRKAMGMSAEELGEKTGISPSTIYRYEKNDIANMGIDKLKSIANALHTHAYALLGWNEYTTLPLHYEQLIALLDNLDDQGFKKVVTYTEDLVASGKYNRNSASCPAPGSKEAKCDQILDDIKNGTNKRAL